MSDEWMQVWRALMIVADVNTMVQNPERAPAARAELELLLADLGN